MAVRIRRNVYTLNPSGPELTWYRRAINSLQSLPRNQPGSWEFIGACHGLRASVSAPSAANGLWRECQHQTWFFLPWHRAYITGFEAIIAAQVVKLGGPAGWALPYWNYSDTTNPNARQLPPAFRNPRLSDGSPNQLWSPRNQAIPPQTVLTVPVSSVSLSALTEPNFSAPVGSASPGFGGPQTAQAVHFGQQFGLPSGRLEDLPHNVIHGAIGGLMRDPDLAALDPIFWLHHCNIDRLWEVWRRQRTPAQSDPTQAQWLRQVKFRILTNKTTPLSFSSQQALNTQMLLHGYKYDSVPPVVPSGAAPVAIRAARKAVRKSAKMSTVKENGPSMTLAAKPELIAANDEAVTLGSKGAVTSVRLAPGIIKKMVDARSMENAAGRAEPGHFYLSLEGVVAKGPARDYRVFIDLPDDDRVPMEVGFLATFGVGTASDSTGHHGGVGLMKVFDITDAAIELGIGEAEIDKLRVTFEPVKRGKLENIPDDFQYRNMIADESSDVTVGRVSIFSE
jgi:tyrosinase